MALSLMQLATILEKQINIIKYTIHCVTVIEWILGGFLFGLAVAVRLDTVLSEWIDTLDVGEYYIGIYVLIFAAFLALVLPLLCCVSVYQEITQLLMANIGGHFFCFLLLMLGNGITLQNSTVNSDIQSSIYSSMKNMIVNSYDDRVSQRLNLLQEEVGCCGAAGPNDYLMLRKPLPNECRDTVTGNGYFHGCSDELLWLLDDKSSWLTGIAFTLGFLQILIATLSYILIQALQKEDRLAYKK